MTLTYSESDRRTKKIIEKLIDRPHPEKSLLTRVNVLNANAENCIARSSRGFCDRLIANVKFFTKRMSHGQSMGMSLRTLSLLLLLFFSPIGLPCQLHEYNEFAVCILWDEYSTCSWPLVKCLTKNTEQKERRGEHLQSHWADHLSNTKWIAAIAPTQCKPLISRNRQSSISPDQTIEAAQWHVHFFGLSPFKYIYRNDL